MAQYSQAELHQMRSNAMRRAQQMRRSTRDYSFLPLREEPTPVSAQAHVKHVPPSPPPLQSQPSNRMTRNQSRQQGMGFPVFPRNGLHPKELLDHLDSDKMMILALLVVLYKDGADQKLLMALAYLLT